MSSPARVLRRLRQGRLQATANFTRRLQNARPGSVLILVVALLVLLALMGTAYISTTRIDRNSSTQNTFNTEIELLLQGVCQVVQQQILTSPGGPTDPSSSTTQPAPMMWTSLVTPKAATAGSPWLAARVPLQNANTKTVYWPQISAPAIGSQFESPYLGTTYGSTSGNNALQPTFITIQTPSGSQMYPALTDGTNAPWLAASASGSGIADSGLVRLPIGELNGITYYYSAFTIDNGSAINASIASQHNDPNATLPGDFYPSCIDLLQMLRPGAGQNSVSVTQQLAALNLYRWGNTAQPNPLTAIYDSVDPITGAITPVPLGFNFNSSQEATWMQLGRRLDNPGINTVSPGPNGSSAIYYQPLPIGESMTLAHRYCLMNPAASPSLLESFLAPSLTTIDAAGMVPVRNTPYGPDQAQQFYSDNFNYENGGGNLRPLLVARNQVSNVSQSLFKNCGAWNSNTSYGFGNWVIGSNGASYVALQDNIPAGNAGAPTVSPQYWVQEPWLDYPVKTPVNTATFGQLWLGYWGVMSANGADTPEAMAGGATNPIYRNPIRASIQVSGNGSGTSGTSNGAGGTVWHVNPSGGDDTGNIQSVINGSAPGDTIAFAAGNYTVSSTLKLLPDRLYNGGGTPSVSGIAGLTTAQTLRLRAALAAINSEQLRSDNSTILTQQINLGSVTAINPTPGANTGGATLVWAGGNPRTSQLALCSGGTTTEFTGFTISGCQLSFENGTFNVHGNTFENTPLGIAVSANSGHIDGNTFLANVGQGIYGYPGTGGTYNNNTIEGTTGDDGIHLAATSGNNTTVSGNVVLGVKRIAIEIQLSGSNINITNNYTALIQPPTGSYMALSIACGNANGVTVTGNTGVSDKANTGACVEIMGYNAIVSGNTSWGFQFAILNGAQGPVLQASGNKVYGGILVSGDSVPWPIAPLVGINTVQALSGNPPAVPQTQSGSGGGSTSTTQPASLPQTYSVTLYATGQQPYITDVYANNDLATQTAANPKGGFIAVSIYNPYNTAISMNNWQWATVNRSAGISGLTVTALSSSSAALSQALSQYAPSSGGAIGPHQRFLFVSDPNMPPGVSADPTVTATIQMPELATALNSELVLIRPRRADGTLSVSPASPTSTNTYDETKNLSDWVPVDCYDFTNLPQTPSPDDASSAEWHYVRPSPAAQDGSPKSWSFVYPYTYDANTANNKTSNPPPNPSIPTSRLFATLVTSGATRYTGTAATLKLGGPDAAPADSTFNSKGLSIQINNTDFGGPKNSAAGQYANQFPFGAFARNGDILQTTYIGAYRIDAITLTTSTDPKTGVTTTTPTANTVEYNPVTMDSAFADDQNDTDNSGENVGRFCPMSRTDSAGLFDDYDPNYVTSPAGVTPPVTIASGPYHFALRLFDFMTVAGPADDYMQNVGPENTAVPTRLGIANVKPKYINAYPQLPSGAITTEDNAPVDGLININTAPWRVLAAMNIADNAADAEQLAKAIIQYRDVDRGDGTPHGPFKSILELNGIAPLNGLPGFRTTLATRAGLNNFDTTGTDNGITDGDLAPFVPGTNDQIPGDFKKQFLAFNRISNLITTRSDSFTTYVLVQGWRNAGTAMPELVVQRRAAFISDRSGSIPSNKVLNVTNIPVN